jgi:hypothetical protein
MQLTFLSVEPPAKTSVSPVSVRDWMETVETSRSSMLQLLAGIGPDGWSGRTSPASFRAIEDEILQAFWGCSPGDGSRFPQEDGNLRELSKATVAHTASHGECLTLNLSEWTGLSGLFLNDAGVCSLSDILETGDVPQRFYLSSKACRGILRRAEKRGKKLPQQLARALQAVAGSEPTSI